MKKMLAAFAMLAMIFAVAQSASAQTLWDQESSGIGDGYTAIQGVAPAGNTTPSSTNWQSQGGGTHEDFAVYDWDLGWVDVTENGIDGSIDIEADIEMFCYQTITDPKIYFHFGNLAEATSADKTAYVNGTFASNNGQYIGISFDGTGKVESDFDTATGIVTNAMVGTIDGRPTPRDISAEKFDVRFLMSWGSGYQTPGNFGVGASGTIPSTLWWLVNEGAPGAYNLTWKIDLLPSAYQPDGNYQLDPVVVAMPVL